MRSRLAGATQCPHQPITCRHDEALPLLLFERFFQRSLFLVLVEIGISAFTENIKNHYYKNHKKLFKKTNKNKYVKI
jgi:hypothetical protein